MGHRSNVDIHEMRVTHGEPFEFLRVKTDNIRPTAEFSRINAYGDEEIASLYSEAVRDYLKSNKGELLLDVATSVELSSGKVVDLYPTRELNRAQKALARLIPANNAV